MMLTPTEIQERIATFPQRCRAAQLKVTHQRTAIFGMLAATESHPTPEDVYSQIRVQLPSISLATVYKVLDQFHRQGFLRRVSTENQVARYDANLTPHYHLNCEGCGSIHDVPYDGSSKNITISNGTNLKGFRISRSDVIFHGLCTSCQTSTVSQTGSAS